MSAIQVCSVFLLGCCAFSSAIDLVVDTTHGPVRGVRSSSYLEDLNVTYFRGIPYGEPPVGDLRFAKPVDKTPWGPAELDATEFGVSCPQPMDYEGWMKEVLPNEDVAEDCLLLNIYVPNEEPDEPYPVMFWIHGGGFTIGQGMLYESTALAGLYGVIVVTINYRLGSFGFLSTSDDHLKGNYGLHDQILALRWVKANAASFGGDPDRITIFGESAGGFSCSILSHTSLIQGEGLFHRAVSQSGTLNPGIVPPAEVHTSFAESIGETLECPDVQDHAKLAECLRAATMEELIEAQSGTILVPCADNEIITDPVDEFLSNSVFKDYDVILGSNSWESTLILPNLPGPLDPTENGLAEPVFNLLVGGEIQLFYDANHDKITDAALFQYTHWDDPDDGHIRTEQYNHFFSDLTFLSPTVHNARNHAPPVENNQPVLPTRLPPGWPFPFPFPLSGMELKTQLTSQGIKSQGVSSEKQRAKATDKSTYHYYFDHRPNFYEGPSYVDGASHSVEILFVFSHTLTMDRANVNKTVTDDEIFLSQQMSTYWTNFVKTGNPNSPDGEEFIGDIEWKEFDNVDQYYMHFKPNMAQEDNVLKSARAEYTTFWNDYVPTLYLDAGEACPTTSTCEPCPTARDGVINGQAALQPWQATIVTLLAFVVGIYSNV